MSGISNQELRDTIEDWYQLKKRVSELEKRIDDCREKVIEYMNSNDIDTVLAGDLCVKKSSLERDVMTKKDVPVDVWEKYSKKNKSWMYKVGKRKE
jgi:hypothetical protein